MHKMGRLVLWDSSNVRVKGFRSGLLRRADTLSLRTRYDKRRKHARVRISMGKQITAKTSSRKFCSVSASA